MEELRNFGFEEHLVRVVLRDGEPWFIGRDVCHALAIRNENDALAALDDDERHAGVAVADPSGTKYAIIISEPGVYRLVFRSRKPEAERFKRWLAHEVLPALRRHGHYGQPPAAGEPDPRPEINTESTLHRLHLIREARALFGRERAAALWRQLGLPSVPPPPPTALDEARVCLRHLLDATLHGEDTIRGLIERALDDDEQARALLLSSGIRIAETGRRDGFVVVNRHKQLEDCFAGTEWNRARWMRVLRRLPGSAAMPPMRFGGPPWRSTFVPADYLDEDLDQRQRILSIS